MFSGRTLIALIAVLAASNDVDAFIASPTAFRPGSCMSRTGFRTDLSATGISGGGKSGGSSSGGSAASMVVATESFIDTELRGAAMRLHTREQAPKEGEAPTKHKPSKAYVTTHADYLGFLVDSLHVYETMEEIVNSRDELAQFRDTGMERTAALKIDIDFMVKEFGLERPEVGTPGREYAEKLKNMESIPEFICHYYNFYFAHTAGGRMIGKQMSALLLDKKTLEFYKWDGDLNEIKSRVKGSIEATAACWSKTEREECVQATADAFTGGGGIMSHLSGAHSPK